MFELIALAVAAITAAVTIGVSESNKNKERRKQESLTSEAYTKEGEEIRKAQWDAVNQGFVSGNLLIKAGYIEALTQKRYNHKKELEKSEFNRLIMWVCIAAAALLIVVIIIKLKK